MAQDFGFNFRLPSAPNSTDPETQRELMVVYNSIRLLADAVSRQNKVYIQAYEDLPLFYLVSFFNNAGTPTARLAVHATYECHGFVSVAALAGQIAEVTLYGLRANSNGNPAGTKLWLSTTPGVGTITSPGAGAQRIGFNLDPVNHWFNPLQLP